ncbi:MAG TPA: DNA circularization N-terminal domain-containing protein [Nitrobacter sp.]|nr:DNA circularization N-terminal domain-containing protein [Nitrobacter sp.]
MVTIARDWLSSLWQASFKGVPFKVERDAEAAGRRIRIHEFPMRDVPYLEDLGELRREFDVMAYVASDSADVDAASLISVCAARGAGVLVLPSHGPITARCLTAERRRDKDRHGYIAIGMRLVREGASSALGSVAMRANLTFAAADNLSAALAASFAVSLRVSGQPGFVVDQTTAAVQDSYAALEGVRTSEPVLASKSAGIRNTIQAAFDAAPAVIVSEPSVAASGIVSIARALGDAMPAAAAVQTFDALSRSAPVDVDMSSRTSSGRALANNLVASYRNLRLAALAAYCEAIVRAELADRRAALTLRANVAEYFEAEMDRLTADQSDLYNAMAGLRNATVDFLSRAVLDLAPVNSVSANMPMPSLFWAWRLYSDPARSADLVARNRVVHPSFMPSEFEALAR